MGNVFKLKEGLGVRKKFFYSEDGEALAQGAKGSCGCPILRDFQRQSGWGFGQSDL